MTNNPGQVRGALALALTLAGAITLAGCAGAPAAQTGPSGATDVAQCVDEATALAKEAMAERPLVMPDAKVDVSPLAGTEVWMIAVVANESSEELFDGFSAAADAAGMSAHFVAAGGQITQMQKLVRSAIVAKAGGIVLFNVDPETVQEPLAEAVDAGITVVDFNNGSASDPLDPGVFAHVAFDMVADGKARADWMLAESQCDMDAALFQLPTYPISTQLIEGTKKEIERLCPDCGVTVDDMDLADLSTSLPSLVSTTLRRNPDAKFVDVGFDSFTGIAGPAIVQLGSDAKLIGHDGLPSTLDAMRAGSSVQAMTAAVPSMRFIGWALLDQLSRGMTGVDAVDWTIPSRIIDETNVGKSDEDIFPAYIDYEPHFLELWGLQ